MINPLELSNWYVLQVRTGKEFFIKNYIYNMFNKNVTMAVFSKEIIHKKNNQDIRLLLPLFPGYIFIKDKIDEILNTHRNFLKNEMINPIRFENRPAKVHSEEMKFLLYNSDFQGNIPLSYGYKNGDSIIITKGPLKNIPGKILFINFKKKKVKVEINLFNRIMNMSLGIDLLDRQEANSNRQDSI
jgi:transcription termination/antitermination protein NusG